MLPPGNDREAGLEEWRLFLDESGRFDAGDDADGTDDVCVAGILHREGLVGAGREALRRAARRTLLWLPWPLHARDLNLPVVPALALGAAYARWESLPPNVVRPPRTGLVDRADALAARLKFAEPRAFPPAWAALVRRAYPRYDDAWQLQKRLYIWRTEAAFWERRQDEVFVALADCLAGLAAAPLAGCPGPHIGIVAAGETERGDSRSDDKGRYLNQLETVLERARDALERRAAGQVHLRVWALEREIEGHRLRRVDLQAVLDVVFAGSRVRAEAVATPFYDEDVHPMLVFADLVANRARHVLENDGPLVVVESTLGDRLGLPCRRDGRSLLAATGAARRYIEAARRGEERPSLGRDGQRKWACEQAREWAGGE